MKIKRRKTKGEYLWISIATLGFICNIMSFATDEGNAQEPELMEVRLYFMDSEELRLVPERRTISRFGNVVDQIKLTLIELINGPRTGLVPTMPKGVDVREVFLDEKGCAYIDFSRDIYQKHPGGTTAEIATISSLVNTLTSNFPRDVRKIRILIDGREAKTLAGHIDISRPIFPFKLE